MSRHTVDRGAPSTESDALGQVYRRLGAIHATLAESDRVDEGLQRRTLDRLMDVLELIEETPDQAQLTRRLSVLAFFPCERVKPAEDGRILIRPLAGGEAPDFPAQTDLTLYGRFTADIGAYAIDLVLVDLATGETHQLGAAGINVEEAEHVGDFAFPVRISFPRPGKYQLRFVANGTLIATHPWLASLKSVA
jgi:hypothetical protein